MNRFKRSVSSLLLTFAAVVALLPAALPAAVPEAHASCNIFSSDGCQDYSKVNYCNSNDPSSSKYCSIDQGTAIVKNGVKDIQTQDKASVYLQKVVTYLLFFLGIVAVLYLIFAGFTIMTSSGEDDKVKKAKGTVGYVLGGIVLIFLAYSIVKFILVVIGGNVPAKTGSGATGFELPSIFPTAYAAAAEDLATQGTFLEYKRGIDEVAIDLDRQYKVDGKISDATLLRLKALVVGTMDTFADKNLSSNAVMAQSVVTSIEVVRKDSGSDAKIGDLASTLSNYLKTARIDTISGKASATPNSGNAPLTVSLRADEVRDPSGVLIPSRNFVWWIKNPSGRTVIGTGPSISYTFREERNYTVFLDVMSASRNSKGKTDVLPLQSSVDVAVLPKLGNVILYLNGTNVSTTDKHKITPSTGRAGLVIDASASQANGGATIIHTDWDFGNGVVAGYAGAPRLERQTYVEGTFRIKLRLTTNENQVVTKELDLQVMDPMATIKADKVEGFANEEFKFQANPNLGGTPLTYEWNILEADGGKVLYVSKVATANYKFPRMGRYVVRLKTMTPNGKQDVDTLNVNINSKDPVALFETRTTGQESPNTLLFDATKSYDPDSLEASKLTFSWNIDGERMDLDNSQRNGAIGKYTFSTLGTHKIGLEITNEQGKTSTVNKDIEVTSLLSVKLSTSPKIASMGAPVNFIAESKEAGVFEWSFGDGGSTEISSEGRISHLYKKSGTYDVTLTVRGANAGGQNSITRKVYVTEANSPFALIGLKIESNAVQPTAGACGENEAFVINRVKPVNFTGEDSVNVDGNTSGLSYAWKYAGKTSTQRDFSYKFDELGCFPVSLTVRSQKTGKTHTMGAYVKVENVLPSFSSLSITTDKADADPVVVKVTANNATDEDGVITSYLWYYYTDSDPEPQDFRITRTNATSFVLPRINGKYYFAVTMEDSNGEKVNSDQQREERYSLTLASDNINTPLISLKADKTNVNAGDKVKFDVIVKNVLQIDISDKAEYKWDFNGDGFYEETGDKPTVTHVFDKPGSFNMKVKATYKGISNTKYQTVNVKNDLRPGAEYIAIGRKFIFLNTTPGLYQTAKWNLGNGLATSENKDTFSYQFNEDDDLSAMSLRLDVSDGKDSKYVDVPLRKDVVNEAKLKKSEDKIAFFSYPRANDGVITVENPGDNVFVYLGESKESPTKYAIDTDTDLDSDLNGDSADDFDNKGTESATSGAPFAIKDLANGHKNRTVRLTTYDAAGKVIATKDVQIVVAYLKDSSETGSGSETKAPEGISDTDKANLEKLKDIIRTKVQEQDRLKLMNSLSALQENWFDQREKTRTILDMETALSELKLDQSTKDDAYSLLEGFLVADSQTKDEVGLAVKVLKSLVPESNAHYKEIVGESGKPGLVDEILSHPTNTALNREIGKKILDYVKDDKNIENKDKVIIKSQLEVIIYGGQANVPANETVTAAADTSSSGILSFILGVGKAIGILIAILLALFLGLFGFFKVSNRNPSLGFQDFIIEKLFGGAPEKKPTSTAPVPAAPKAPEPKPMDPLASMAPAKFENLAQPAVDPLASVPVQETKLAVAETSNESFVPSPDAEVALPAWLKGSSLDPSATVSEPATAPVPEASAIQETDSAMVVEPGAPAAERNDAEILSDDRSSITEAPAAIDTVEVAAETAQASDDLPDWLKSSTYSSVETPEPETPVVEETAMAEASEVPEPAFNFFESEEETATAQEPETPVATETAPISDDLPDWLKGMDSSAIDKEVEEELAATPSAIPEPFFGTGATQPEAAPAKEPEVPTLPASDDLPDWLKSSIVITGTPEAASMTSEVPSADRTEKKPKRAPKKPAEDQSSDSAAPAPVAPASDDLPEWLKP